MSKKKGQAFGFEDTRIKAEDVKKEAVTENVPTVKINLFASPATPAIVGISDAPLWWITANTFAEDPELSVIPVMPPIE